MDLANIELARQLIAGRSTLNQVVEKSEKWRDGHFEFVEHCGRDADRISVSYFPELTKEMVNLIKNEIADIESKLESL